MVKIVLSCTGSFKWLLIKNTLNVELLSFLKKVYVYTFFLLMSNIKYAYLTD